MDDEIIKQFNENLRKLLQNVNATQYEFDELGNELNEQQKKERARDDARKRAADRIREREKQEFDAAVAKWSKMGNSALRLTTSMTSQEGAFNAMGDITAMFIKGISKLLGFVPYFGGALQGLGEAGAEVVKIVTQATGKAFQTFEKISGSGIVASFEDMQTAGDNTGLMYEQLEAVLAKNTVALNAFGDTTLDGSRNLQNILKINYQASEDFYLQAQKLGIGFQEFAEMQSSYILQQTQAGFVRGKTDKMLAAEAREYAYELDLISKLTGKSRKEVQEQQERLLNDTRYRAKLTELEAQGEEGKLKADNIRQFLSLLPKEFEEGFKDIIVSGGVPTTEAAKRTLQAMELGGVKAGDLAKSIADGTTNWKAAMTEVTNAMPEYIRKASPLAKLIGDQSPITALFGEAHKLAQLQGKNFEEIAQQRKDEVERQKALIDRTAEVAKNAQTIAQKMQAALTSPGLIIAANEKVSAALKSFASQLDRIMGTSSSAGYSGFGGAGGGGGGAGGGGAGGSTAQASANQAAAQDALAQATAAREAAVAQQGRGSDAARAARIAEANARQEATRSSLAEHAAMSRPRSGTSFNMPPSVNPSAPASAGIPALKNGALISPKIGGTLVQVAEAGQPEAVVPLPDGRSIPVTVSNGNNSVLVDELIAMNRKYDTILDLIYKGNVMQNDFLKSVV